LKLFWLLQVQRNGNIVPYSRICQGVDKKLDVLLPVDGVKISVRYGTESLRWAEKLTDSELNLPH